MKDGYYIPPEKPDDPNESLIGEVLGRVSQDKPLPHTSEARDGSQADWNLHSVNCPVWLCNPRKGHESGICDCLCKCKLQEKAKEESWEVDPNNIGPENGYRAGRLNNAINAVYASGYSTKDHGDNFLKDRLEVFAAVNELLQQQKIEIAEKVEANMLDRIYYIGEQLPDTRDDRPKFVLLGTPAEFLALLTTK